MDMKKVTSLTVNQAINGAYDFLSKGTKASYKAYGAGAKKGVGGVMDAIKAGHTNEAGGLALGAVAGSYMAASGAARLVGGGGLYKDRSGNTDLIGVPFI
jgi:hypothetical protein